MKQKNELKSIKERNLTTGWLLCAAVVFSGLLPVSASPYEIEGTVLKITVPEGVTNEVEVSELVCANDNTVTEIRKLGRGGFLMNDKTAIPNYAGDIYVDQGTWIVASSNALGKLDFDNKGKATHGENTGKVYVAEGASIDLASDDRYINNSGKKVIVNGHGVSGNGALTVSVSAANYYKDVLGNNLVLEGNSSIWMPKIFNFYLLDSIIDLNENTFTVKADASTGSIVVGSGATVGPGTLEFVNKGSLVLQGKTTFEPGCNLVFNDSSKLAVKSNDRCDAAIVWNTDGAVTSEQSLNGDDYTNTLHGAVQLDKTMRVGITKSGSFGLAGTVTGAGGLNMFWNNENVPEVPTNSVTLANADSTFEGGVSVRNLIVNVKENGAVPAEGGVFALTNSVVNFDLCKSYMLPNGILHVDGERSVTGGLGKWKTLVKIGSGTVDYNSVIGADVLELKSGVMKISEQTYTSHRFAGLIEGVSYFTDASDGGSAVGISQGVAKNNGIVYTNKVVMSPYLMNTTMGDYWTTKRPADDTDHKVKAHCTTYSGYMWNRSNKSVDWTFACNVANYTVFHFDDELMFEHNPSSSKAIAKVTIRDIAPGSVHRIRFGNHSKYNKPEDNKTQGGISSSTTDPVWGKQKLGLRWDRLGRDTTDPANFEILEDPGDGSLFTWAIPGDDVFYPGTNESRKFDYLPEFDLVKFTGGTLHLNGVTNTVSEVEGLPNMAGTGKLVIKDKWTIDAADLADKAKSDGLSLAFGEDVELVINKNRAVKSSNGTYEWTVFESEDDISGSISVKDPEMAKRWRVKISGKTVRLKYYPAGTVIIVR